MQGRGIQPQALRGSGPHVVQQHVGPGHQPRQGSLAFRSSQVEHQGLLAPVQVDGVPVGEQRPVPGPGRI